MVGSARAVEFGFMMPCTSNSKVSRAGMGRSSEGTMGGRSEKLRAWVVCEEREKGRAKATVAKALIAWAMQVRMHRMVRAFEEELEAVMADDKQVRVRLRVRLMLRVM